MRIAEHWRNQWRNYWAGSPPEERGVPTRSPRINDEASIKDWQARIAANNPMDARVSYERDHDLTPGSVLLLNGVLVLAESVRRVANETSEREKEIA